jgi:hypothetical protein
MLHGRLISALGQAPGGLTTTAIAERVDGPMDPLNLAAVEATLLLSPEVIREGDRWKLLVKGRSAQILAAIESCADSSGRKIFRLAAALSGLPAHDHPTEEELRAALESSNGRFALLPNAMIRRNQ